MPLKEMNPKIIKWDKSHKDYCFGKPFGELMAINILKERVFYYYSMELCGKNEPLMHDKLKCQPNSQM